MKKVILSVFLILIPCLIFAQSQGNVVRDVPGHSIARWICPTNGQILKWNSSLGTFECATDAGSSGVYSQIQEEGANLTIRSTLNFIGATITCADDAGNTRTNCTVTSDGVGYDEILEEGSGLTKRAKLNFIGGSVTCTDNGGSSRTDCTFTDGVGYDEILEEGSGLTKRAKVNFIGSSITCADNGGSSRTDCTLTDGVGYDEVLDEGSGLTKRAKVNFVGANVACVDNSGSSRTDCTIAAGNEGPPWGGAIRHYAYLKYDQSSQTAMHYGGGVPDFDWTRSSSAGALSVTPSKKHIYTDTTITAASHGYSFNTASSVGYVQWKYRPVVHYRFGIVDTAASDSTSYKMYASICNGVSALPLPNNTTMTRNCTAGTSTITNGGAGIQGCLTVCWDKGVSANILYCSNTEVDTGGGGNSTQNCTDSGIAAPTSATTEVDVVLDALDGSNQKAWINGTAFTMTTNLPTQNINRMVMKLVGVRTTAAPSDLELILYNAEEWWD